MVGSFGGPSSLSAYLAQKIRKGSRDKHFVDYKTTFDIKWEDDGCIKEQSTEVRVLSQQTDRAIIDGSSNLLDWSVAVAWFD